MSQYIQLDAIANGQYELTKRYALYRIMRLIFMVPVFALVYFIAGSIPTSALYLRRWANFYESVALASNFLLLIAYVCPIAEEREIYLRQSGPSTREE